MAEKKKITVTRLRKMKQEPTPIAMLTAYDAPTAHLAELPLTCSFLPKN